ncbi:hypothetical protein GSY74_07650 [Sulfurovum sp. bin170]|uniref:phage tail protein n=1 Tax=Sulfurovum sp. bin170 TaxID=2695268 RepID=UPI0013DF4A9A|nr:hypothetical protein [Sulfurovum sp. bin170]NEW61153.1 hypothetical protein [Sulfurovum sp. bin170]
MSSLMRKTKKRTKPNSLNQKSIKNSNNKKSSNDILTLHKSVGNKTVEKLVSSKGIKKETLVKSEPVTKKPTQEAKKSDAKIANEPKAPQDKKLETVKAPTNPYRDKAFTNTLKYIKKSRDAQKTHPNSKDKLTEVEEASHLSKEEQEKKNSQSAHYNSIESSSDSAKSKKFTPESFKKSLEKELTELENSLPKDADDAKNFKDTEPINAIKNSVNSNVTKEKESMVGSLATNAKEKKPPKSNLAVKSAKPIPKTTVGKAPKPINKKDSTPKPKHKSEISMERESQSIDEYMEESKLTESQLKKSNEPEFLKALDSKTVAQKKLKEVPQTYKKKENQILRGARGEASVLGKEGLDGMFSSRVGSFEGVLTKQTSSQKSSQNEKQTIDAKFEKIYNETKTDVTAKLNGISTEVNKLFDKGGQVDNAKKTFEKNVEDKLDDIYSWTDIFTRKKHKSEIKEVFISEKAKFISTLNTIFDHIAIVISTGLNEAIKVINDGREETKEIYDGLNKQEKKLAKDSLDTFNDRYDNLEESVSNKEKELAQGLAQQYKQNVASLDKSFEEIRKKASATWLDGAINAIKGVIETIKKLRKLVSELLSAIQKFLPIIMADPIGFAKKLFAGIGEGIALFKANIQKHLLGGFIQWLTGAMGSAGITIPVNLFSLKGIFSLVMQILGLGWDYLRKKSVKLLGEPMVKAMETGLEMFQIVRTKGIVGIWEHIKEQFNDLKETIIDSIKNMLITQVIMAGIKWLVSLLVPGGGFIKAIMAIKDLIVFFVESAIMLIPTLITSIKALASGNVKGVAKAVEKGLGLLIALVINLFAKLIGLGGLAKKVMKIIKRIRKRIDKAINKLILKARRKFKGLVKKGKAKVKGAVKKLIGWFKIKVKFKAKDGKNHSLNIKGSKKKPKLVIRSKETQFDKFIKAILDGKDENKKKLAEIAFENYQNWRTAVHKEADKEDERAQSVKSKETEDAMEKIAVDMKELFGHSEDDLPEYEKGKNVIYQSSREGVGEKMTAHVLSKLGEEGTIPSSPKGVYKTLFKRKGESGKKSFYVQGHLLNENMHGSGREEENLTPLSVQGNKNHSIEIEEVLKRVTKTGGVISYTVDPVYATRGLETSEAKRPKKFSDKEWGDVKEIRELESKKIVPTHLTVKAYLMEKDETKKFGFTEKKSIKSKDIKNPIEEKELENYNVGGEGIQKEDFILREKTIEQLKKLKGIGETRAEEFYNRLQGTDDSNGKKISNYTKLIGISKEKLDEKNPQYNIIGSLSKKE